MLKTSLAAALILAGGPALAKPPTSLGPVFVIALENHNFTQPKGYQRVEQIFGNPAAPFINGLLKPGTAAAKYVSYATNYLNVPPQNGRPMHPSEPNYVWSEAGVHGKLNDNDPYPNNVVDAPSLTAELQAAGMSWKSYQEDTDLLFVHGQLTNTVAPISQWTVPLVSFSGSSPAHTNPYNGDHQYEYAAKHNPPVFFRKTNGGDNTTPSNPESLHYAPMQQLAVDLAADTVADYNWITPDALNDMHSYLNDGFTYHGVHYVRDPAAIAAGDNFLSQVVPMIMASKAFQRGGVIVIWDDEAEGDTGAIPGRFTITEIVISKLAKGNAFSTAIHYDHSSDLRTWQRLFHLTPTQGYRWLGDSSAATPLSALFQPDAVPELFTAIR